MAPTAEQQAFLEAHRLVIVGIPRDRRPPHTPPVYYVTDGRNVVISTTASRFKARAIRRNAQISLCVLAEEFPFPYLLVYGNATIDESGAAEVMREIGGKMSGNPIPDSAMPAIEERARKEGRVVLHGRPTEFFSTTSLPRQSKSA